LEINITQSEENVRFTIIGDIDQRGAQELKQHFTRMDIKTLKEVVFDFGKVGHIGSAGIGKLLLFYKDMAVQGGIIRVENVSDTLHNLFSVLKLDSIFTITKS
jgi:anti-anti-sigma factor